MVKMKEINLITATKSSGECCPVCQVTLWPETIKKHYQQELEKLSVSAGSATLNKRKSSHSVSSRERKTEERTKKLVASSELVRVIL